MYLYIILHIKYKLHKDKLRKASIKIFFYITPYTMIVERTEMNLKFTRRKLIPFYKDSFIISPLGVGNSNLYYVILSIKT